jgi:ribosomal protein S18 acetylase RimI-like enzyme
MVPVATVAEVFDSIQRVKSAATDFGTNFFPVQKKLQAWIDHQELFAENRGGAAFFFRKDRDFWHLYFCAGNATALARELTGLKEIKEAALTADLVGNETSLAARIGALEGAGFRRYSHLQRMARLAKAHAFGSSANEAEVVLATKRDAVGVLALLDASFDKYADQLPVLYEIEAAVEAGQMLVVRAADEIAALMHFETQGVTSTVRFWAVAAAHQNRRLGSALMKRYFESQSAVKRFILWVVAENRNAVEKYQHYGYAADGLIDHVLVNGLIRK